MSERPPIEQAGIELHSVIKELATNGPGAFQPEKASGTKIGVLHTSETDIVRLTTTSWQDRLVMEAVEIDGNGRIVKALRWDFGDEGEEHSTEDEEVQGVGNMTEEEARDEVSRYLNDDEYWDEVRALAERARNILPEKFDDELTELDEGESGDGEIELGEDFWEGVYRRAERIRNMTIADLMEPFEPDENKLKEWRDLLEVVNPETDRLPDQEG